MCKGMEKICDLPCWIRICDQPVHYLSFHIVDQPVHYLSWQVPNSLEEHIKNRCLSKIGCLPIAWCNRYVEATIAIQESRMRTIQFNSLLVDNKHWDLGTISARVEHL